tara:strand:- start:4958 stop:5392 length:435 start_codon:yes stop_codon:yes gene_type:complete
MILVSHRGNYKSPNEQTENTPHQISSMLKMGLDVEIDVWLCEDQLFLGHDNPEYKTSLQFLQNEKLWCHAKNLQALRIMVENNVHCFWHQEDDYTLTSKGYIWTYPNRPICSRSIIVCKTLEDTLNCYKANVHGICSDYVGVLK